jgi:hypothetical protein
LFVSSQCVIPRIEFNKSITHRLDFVMNFSLCNGDTANLKEEEEECEKERRDS